MEKETNINKLIELSCTKKRYHYFIVLLCLLMAVNMNIFNVGIIYFKRIKGCDQDKSPCEYSIIFSFDDYKGKVVYHTLFSTFPYIGNFLFAFVFAPLANLLGHKLMIFIGGISFIFSSSMCILFNQFHINFGLLILSALSSNIMLYSSLFLGQELASSRQRALIGSIINTGFCFSGLLHLVYFWQNLNWHVIFSIDICIASVLLIPFNYWVFDSPKTYLENNQIEEGIGILENISGFNNDKDGFKNSLRNKEYQAIIKNLMKPEEKSVGELQDESNISYNFCGIWKYVSVYKPFVILCIMWFCTSFIYNGIAFILEWEDKFMMVNTIAIYSFECIAYFICGKLINIQCLGRKKTTYILFLSTSLFFLIMIFVVPDNKEGENRLLTFFSLFICVGRFVFSGIYTILYTYTPECYPSGFRTTCFGINVLFAAVGSIAMSICVEGAFTEYKKAFYITGGIMALICGILTFFLDETVNQPFMSEIKEIIEKKQMKIKKEKDRRELIEKRQREIQEQELLM